MSDNDKCHVCQNKGSEKSQCFFRFDRENFVDFNQMIRNIKYKINTVRWHLEQHGDHGNHGIQVVLLLSLRLEQRGAMQQQLQFLKITATAIFKQTAK